MADAESQNSVCPLSRFIGCRGIYRIMVAKICRDSILHSTLGLTYSPRCHLRFAGSYRQKNSTFQGKFFLYLILYS